MRRALALVLALSCSPEDPMVAPRVSVRLVDGGGGSGGASETPEEPPPTDPPPPPFELLDAAPLVVLRAEDYDPETGIWADTSGNDRHAIAPEGARPALEDGALVFAGAEWFDLDLELEDHRPLSVFVVWDDIAGGSGCLLEGRSTSVTNNDTVRLHMVVLGPTAGVPGWVRPSDQRAGNSTEAGAIYTVHGAGQTGLDITEIRWGEEVIQSTDGNGEWIAWDGVHAAPGLSPLAGIRIGSRFIDTPPYQGLVAKVKAIILIAAPSAEEREGINEVLFDTYDRTPPYFWTEPRPTIVPAVVPPGDPIYLATIGNSGWQPGVALHVLEARAAGRVVTVGTDTPSTGGGVKLDAHGGRTTTWFASDPASPLTDGIGNLDIAAWLAGVTDSSDVQHDPHVVIFSLVEGVTLNTLPGAELASALTTFFDDFEDIAAAIEVELPDVVWVVTTGHPGNERPSSPAGGNWVIHPDRASWLEAQAQAAEAIESYFEGRERVVVWRFHEQVSGRDGNLPYESTVPTLFPGLHLNPWYGSTQQGEAFALFLVADVLPLL